MEENRKKAALLFILAVLVVTFFVFVYLILGKVRENEQNKNAINNSSLEADVEDEQIMNVTREDAIQNLNETDDSSSDTGSIDSNSGSKADPEEKRVNISVQEAEEALNNSNDSGVVDKDDGNVQIDKSSAVKALN